MTLDIDCIRDALLELETFEIGCYKPSDFVKSIEKHGKENVLYTLYKLAEAGFINTTEYYRSVDGTPHIDFIYDMTFDGHEFLADLKPQSNWEKISAILKQGGCASVKTIGNVAVTLGTEALKIRLGLASPPIPGK